jgi:hypothetical protein
MINKIINLCTLFFRNVILLETGLMQRELNIWHAEKPKCTAGKTTTEESLVSVEIKDIASLIAFLIIGFIGSFTILVLEIIVHRHETTITAFLIKNN